MSQPPAPFRSMDLSRLETSPVFSSRWMRLIIPTLAEGRMPYVAITKAYDYPGLNRPIVASNLPRIAALLRDGEEAVLFAPGQAEDCTRALGSLMAKPQFASRLVDSCRQLAAKLSWNARAERYWAIL